MLNTLGSHDSNTVLKKEIALPVYSRSYLEADNTTNAEQIVFDLLIDVRTGKRITDDEVILKAEKMIKAIKLSKGLVNKTLDFQQINHYSDGIYNYIFGYGTIEDNNELLFSIHSNNDFPFIYTQTECGNRIEKVTHLQFKNKKLIGGIIIDGQTFNLNGKNLTQFNNF